MSQNPTDTTRRRTDTRPAPRRTDGRRPRRLPTPEEETDAPLVPDLGRRGRTDTGSYRPDPFDRMLMRDAE